MAKENKFGTFGGVYTPSLLTILGVIMYLRLPWVVGHAGLGGAMGIILVAHVISVATGLSISSIATDRNVGAGGPYYIVSRSLGLPIGGALGLALFTGLCFGTSLYVIGLSESVLGAMSIEVTPTSIRIAGTISLLVITIITIISTSLAIKTQFLVLALIIASLAAIFLGEVPDEMTRGGSSPSERAPTMAMLFGIFFPAVTGFTAGVNMSGDLKDPKAAIPRGTMAAIFTGMLVYLTLAIFLYYRVPKEALIEDPNVLSHIAWKLRGDDSWWVLLGIWGATFSSGLGSILGAPRILQALSTDRITPAIFAKGTGPTKEPRNALILAFLLAEAGILIAELNAIAEIVSMVFLTMYAFLNLSCAIEAKVSPDFRPAFRIPATVSIVGALTCIVIMIQLNLAAMMGATAIMVGLFVALQRKQLKLESGDAWEGVWSTMIRSGLYRITGGEQQQRNWRPNILAFRSEGATSESYEQFGRALITSNGILTDFEIQEQKKRTGARPSTAAPSPEPASSPDGALGSLERSNNKDSTGEKAQRRKKKKRPQKVADERVVGMFRRRLSVDGSPFDEIQTVCQHYGFSGLEPNALLLPWDLAERDPVEFAETVDLAADQDFNVLVHRHIEPKETAERIDIWWRVDAGNVTFCMALLRFITRAKEWEKSNLRFLLLSSDSANNDNLRSTMRRILREGRVDASVKVVSDSFGDRPFVDRVRTLSEDAALTLLGLPNQGGNLDEQAMAEMQELCAGLGRVLFVRGSSFFKEVLPIGRSAAISELPPIPEDGMAPGPLPEMTVTDVPDIATAATEYSESYQRLVGRLGEQCLKKVYGRHVELIRKLKTAAERHLSVDKAAKLGNPRKLRTTFNRQQSAFLLECKSHLEAFAKDDLPELRSILEGGIDAYLNDDQVLAPEGTTLLVSRKRVDFKPDGKDSRAVRRFKSRRRLGAWLRRRDPQYRIPVSSLKRYYYQKSIEKLLTPAIFGLVAESHQLFVQVGKLLSSNRANLAPGDDEVDLAELFKAQRKQLIDHLDDLNCRGKELIRRRNWELIVGALETSQAFSNDICGFDFQRLIQKERIPAPRIDTSELEAVPELWAKHQAALGVRAGLALSLCGVQHRLTTTFGRTREAVAIGLKNGALLECQRVFGDLDKLRSRLSEGPGIASSANLHVDLKNHFDPGPIIDSLVQESSGTADDLPATLETLTDEAIQALEEGRLEAVEHVQVPVRRLMQFLTETELVGGVQEALSATPRKEQRALGIAQDIVRLINFQLSEVEATADLGDLEFEAQMRPVIENGIERLKNEIADLEKLAPAVLATIDQRLHVVIDGTNAYELSAASSRLDQHIRVYHGRKAVSGARGYVKRALGRVKDGAVNLIYRRSEGVLLAQRRRGTLRSDERAVDRIASLVRREVPEREVLSSLPFYYRQLFFGQSGINETFWVGRKEQLKKAKQALAQFDSGTSGSLLVIGDRLSGKSALLQKLSTDVFERRKIYRVHAPPGGSIEPKAFDRALKKALGAESTESTEVETKATLAALPSGSVVIMDDLNLWWERSPQGFLILEEIAKAIAAHGSRVLFVLALETQAFRLINRLLPLSDTALSVIECGPFPAEALKSIVTLRHSSTGIKYRYGGKSEESLGDVALARLFSQHFDHSGGSVGGTLRAWLASIEKVKGESLEILAPTRDDWEALDTLKESWVALLVQLALHKQITVDRLRRVSGLSAPDLRRELEALSRMGLVARSQRRILEIEPAMLPALSDRFLRRGVLS